MIVLSDSHIRVKNKRFRGTHDNQYPSYLSSTDINIIVTNNIIYCASTAMKVINADTCIQLLVNEGIFTTVAQPLPPFRFA